MICEECPKYFDRIATVIPAAVRSAIDWSRFSARDRMKHWDRMVSTVEAATHAGTVEEFIRNLCRSWKVASIHDPSVLEVIEKVRELDADLDFLAFVRKRSRVIVLRLRVAADGARAEGRSTVRGDAGRGSTRRPEKRRAAGLLGHAARMRVEEEEIRHGDDEEDVGNHTEESGNEG